MTSSAKRVYLPALALLLCAVGPSACTTEDGTSEPTKTLQGKLDGAYRFSSDSALDVAFFSKDRYRLRLRDGTPSAGTFGYAGNRITLVDAYSGARLSLSTDGMDATATAGVTTRRQSLVRSAVTHPLTTSAPASTDGDGDLPAGTVGVERASTSGCESVEPAGGEALLAGGAQCALLPGSLEGEGQAGTCCQVNAALTNIIVAEVTSAIFGAYPSDAGPFQSLLQTNRAGSAAQDNAVCAQDAELCQTSLLRESLVAFAGDKQDWGKCVFYDTAGGAGLGAAVSVGACEVATFDSVLRVVCPLDAVPGGVVGGILGGIFGTVKCTGRAAIDAVLQSTSEPPPPEDAADGESESAPVGKCGEISPGQLGDFLSRHAEYTQARNMKPLGKYYFPPKLPPGARMFAVIIDGVVQAVATVWGSRNGAHIVHGFASARNGAGRRLLECLENELDDPFKVAPSPDSRPWWGARGQERGISPTSSSEGTYYIFKGRL